MPPDEPADARTGRGERLWTDMGGDGLSPAQRVLLEEACRIADRLDRLDDLLAGRDDAWLKFHARNEDGSIVEVVVDKALAEARQQAVALKALITEIRIAGAADETPKAQGGGSDDLAARRAARREAAGL